MSQICGMQCRASVHNIAVCVYGALSRAVPVRERNQLAGQQVLLLAAALAQQRSQGERRLVRTLRHVRTAPHRRSHSQHNLLHGGNNERATARRSCE